MKRIAVLLLTAAAFGLRLGYLLHSHPFIDEFTTVLAAQAILGRGLPVLPSGLFYEHGLLFSYLEAPFVALAGENMLFAVVRLPSLLIGTLTVPLLYWIGRRWLSPRAGLVAAALLAFSPEGIMWGGRARMYALAQFLVLILVFWAYEGSRGKSGLRLPRTWSGDRLTSRGARWLALLVLLVALLAQFGTLIFVPPLLVGALVVGWLTRPGNARPWFLRRAALTEGVVLIVVVGLSVLVKRLGRPLGAAPLSSGGAGDLVGELIGTITYQAGLVLDGESTVKFLARQFGVPHNLWLTLVAVVGGLLALAVWLSARGQPGHQLAGSGGGARNPLRLAPYSRLYLWLVFGLGVVEMLVLLEPWRRNPRYLVMALPLFYLMVAGGLEQISNLKSVSLSRIAVVVFVVVQVGLLVPDLRVAYRTPEPAYEEAFQYVADEWQAGDVLLTMNTSAAGLFLGQADQAPAYRFAMQEDAAQFLLDAESQPVDRWLGAPWVGTAADFNQVLNEHARTWFVVDTIRLPVYYRGDWLAVLNMQMDLVWSQDNALVYLTRPDRVTVQTELDVSLDARFDDVIALDGYSLTGEEDYLPATQAGACEAGQALCLKPGGKLHIALFWHALAPSDFDYTVFVHIRDDQGRNVSQRDGQPFDGLYPTSQWQPGETVVVPVEVDLPPGLPDGRYSVYVGLYRLDTLERLALANDTSGENAVILNDALQVVSGER